MLALGGCAAPALDLVGPQARTVPAGVLAAVCATTCRAAFPGADAPWLAGAAVRHLGGDRFQIEYAIGADGAARHAGNARIDLHDAPGPGLAASLTPGQPTALPPGAAGTLRIEIDPGAAGAPVTVRLTGTLAGTDLARRLRADLAAVAAIAAADRALAGGRPVPALAALAPWLGGDLVQPPGRHWRARAFERAARAHRALAAPDRARRCLEAALDHDPELAGARADLATLCSELSDFAALRHHRRALAALGGGDLDGLAARVQLGRGAIAAAEPGAARLAQAHALDPGGDPAAALRAAQQAYDAARPQQQPRALRLLARAAERCGDHRRARELHLARALLVGPTPDIVLCLSRAARALGDPTAAAHLLDEHWRRLAAAGEGGALAELQQTAEALGPMRASRLLGRVRETLHTSVAASPPR